MRARQISSALLGLVTVLALLIAVSAGGAGASPLAALDQSWADPAGDAIGGAPDITAVSVSNDAAGLITMTVTVPMSTDTGMLVLLDTNLNSRLDYAIAAMGMGPGVVSPLVLAYDASGNASVGSIASLRMSATASTVTLSFVKTDAGVADAFGFKLVTFTAAQLDGGQFGDELPPGNMLNVYMLTTPPPPPPPPPAYKPMIGAPATTPATAVAGKRFTVAFPVTRSDTSEPLTTGTMTCDPSVSGKVVAHAESFKGGTAKLSFVVPRTAKGKLLKVKVTIKAGAGSATKVATFRVK